MFKDSLNFLSILTFRKIVNWIKIYVAYFLSRIAKKRVLWGLPTSIAIEPTSLCNLKCPECPTGSDKISRPSGDIEFALFKKIIDELAPYLTYVNLSFQGEPYLHPEFFELMNYANERNIYTATSTNAHFLTEENARKTIESGLNRIIISLDGVTQQSYSKYRKGGSFTEVLKGIRNLIQQKNILRSNTPIIILQFLVFKHNQHEIDEIKKIGKKLQVDRVFIKSAQIYNYQNNSLIPTIERYSRYRRDIDGNYSIKNELKNCCKQLWISSVVTNKGIVVPCCFDKNVDFSMGDLKNNSFKQIWRGEEYQKFRTKVLKSRKEINMCKNCTEGLKVMN